MSLLTLCQEAAALCGIAEPTSVLSSGDDTYIQMARLAQVEGDELSRIIPWRGIKVTAYMTGDGSTTFWNLPADFDRFPDGDSLWRDERRYEALDGPLSDNEFVAITSSNENPTLPVWRLYASSIEVYPALDDAEIVNFDYYSKFWICDSTGVTVYRKWSSDTDYALIPEDLITLGVVWRWKRAKGLAFEDDRASYMAQRMEVARKDGGNRILSASEYFPHVISSRRNAYKVIG
jgi:hypothetical protein